MANTLVALHILKDLQDRLRYEAKLDISTHDWECAKYLLGDEHAQIVFEMSIPDEVRDHTLLYGLF